LKAAEFCELNAVKCELSVPNFLNKSGVISYIDPSSIAAKLNSLKRDKAARNDNMPPRIFMCISGEIAIPGAEICRKPLDTGCVLKRLEKCNSTVQERSLAENIVLPA